MKIKLRYPIRRGKSGFKSCVSHYAFVAEQLVKDHETEIDENDLNKIDYPRVVYSKLAILLEPLHKSNEVKQWYENQIEISDKKG